MNATLWLVPAVASVLLVAAACGNDDEDAADASPTKIPGATYIVLGETNEIDGDGAGATEFGVLIESEGTYVLSGSLADGMVVVRAPGAKVELVLAGVSITHSAGPAILFASAAEAVVTLVDESENFLRDGGEAEEDAALYAAAPLTINGTGKLNVVANYEGISSTLHITIDGGDIHVEAQEDGLNASEEGVSEINVRGGHLYAQSEIGDAIDSNGTIHISGGTVIALGAPASDGSNGLDSDLGVTIDGGTVVATGERPSIPTAESAQKSVLVTFDGVQEPNTLVSLQSEGEHLLAFAPPIGYPNLLFSAGSVADGVSYDVYSGGTTNGSPADGLSTDGSSGGTLIASVTTESVSGDNGP